MSASNTPTLYPCLAKFFAISADTVDFPTPPLPLITPIILLILFSGLLTTEQLDCSLLQDPFDGHELQFDISIFPP
ncbi:hypothetical protein SDC9_152191 [bioreactor metagenome]|uniref:Uncharacterized protein n=1 Tax=bioreactor metagenome TaxID=1076179 RepID=A0A645EUP0_9ZZZZ